jgi:hypothetical protein
VAESRNRDDQGLRTVNLRVQANARATNDTVIAKGEDDDIASKRIGTYNIINGRAGNLEGALWAMNKMNMDIRMINIQKGPSGMMLLQRRQGRRHRAGLH